MNSKEKDSPAAGREQVADDRRAWGHGTAACPQVSGGAGRRAHGYPRDHDRTGGRARPRSRSGRPGTQRVRRPAAGAGDRSGRRAAGGHRRHGGRAGRGQAAAGRVLLLGLARGRRGRRPGHLRGRGRARAAARGRACARRRAGRQRHPPGQADHPPALRRTACGGGLAGCRSAVRSRNCRPARRSAADLDRRALPRQRPAGHGAEPRPGRPRPDAHRADGRPVPGPAGAGRGAGQRGRRAARRDLQDREVHDRAAAAPRRRAGRAAGRPSRPGRRLHRLRAAAGRGLPAPRRRARRVRRPGRDRQAGRR